MPTPLTICFLTLAIVGAILASLPAAIVGLSAAFLIEGFLFFQSGRYDGVG